MAIEQATSARALPPELLPTFATSLIAIARAHGFVVIEPEIDSYDNDKEHQERIFSTWSGTIGNLQSLGWFVPSQRVPLSGGRMNSPSSSRFQDGRGYERPFFSAHVTVKGDLITVQPDFGPVPERITRLSELEVICYRDETAYYGTAESLIACKVCRAQQIPGPKKSSRSDGPMWAETPRWATRRFPDGLYVHWLQNEASRQKEFKRWEEFRSRSTPMAAPTRPSHLRLVVDNDRSPPAS